MSNLSEQKVESIERTMFVPIGTSDRHKTNEDRKIGRPLMMYTRAVAIAEFD